MEAAVNSFVIQLKRQRQDWYASPKMVAYVFRETQEWKVAYPENLMYQEEHPTFRLGMDSSGGWHVLHPEQRRSLPLYAWQRMFEQAQQRLQTALAYFNNGGNLEPAVQEFRQVLHDLYESN